MKKLLQYAILGFSFVFSISLVSQELLLNNGGIVNQPGVPDLSVIQNVSLGMTTWAYSTNEQGSGSGIPTQLADDVTPVGGDWEVSNMTLFGLTIGAPVPNTEIGEVVLRVWDGDPREGGNIVWGDFTTNRFTATQWTGAYRVFEDEPSEEDYALMEVELETPGLVLNEGTTYWFNWRMSLKPSSPFLFGPYMPPVAIWDESTTGNAIRFREDEWQELIDAGTSGPQGLPFLLFGTSTLGVEDNALSSAISFYPNPADQTITIKNDSSIGLERIQIYNLLGQKVLQFRDLQELDARELDISSLQTGSYLITFDSEEGSLTKKLIKQ